MDGDALFTFTLTEPIRMMSLRIEISGEERVTEIRRIANEFWTEGEYVLTNGCAVLRDEEKISDVVTKDDIVFIMDCSTA